MPRLTYDAVGQLRGRPGGHLLSGPAIETPPLAQPAASGSPVCRFSIRLSAACSGVSAHHPLHEDAGGVDVVRVELAGLDELLDLGDRDPPAHRGERVEVARRVAVDEVAVPVALPGAHQPEVGDDRLLQDVLAALAVSNVASPSAARPR